MTIYYTYCSYETDKGDAGPMYIGFRKCPENKTPWTDNYHGTQTSKKNLEFKNNPNKCKVILGLFDNREEALAHEIELHDYYDVARDPRFANRAKQTSTGFSVCMMGEDNPNFGKEFKPETLYKMSQNNRGENHPMFGKNHKPESLQKMSESRKGKKKSPEHCKKISESMKSMGSTKGEKNPNFDHTLYDFENKELGTIEMQVTRYHLVKKYDLLTSKVGAVVKGKRNHHKGWTLLNPISKTEQTADEVQSSSFASP